MGKHQTQNQAKWCPRCGKVCRLQAKVCTQCGHRFRTNFSAETFTEIPISQPSDEPIVLPTNFDQSIAPNVAITAPDNLEGEPAPDISDKQLDEMRYTSPANTDPYGRLILSLKKGRS